MSGHFLIRSPERKFLTDAFSSGDVTILSPVLYREYCIQDGNLVVRFSRGRARCKFRALFFATHALLPVFPVESWVLEWSRIRVGDVWTGKSDWTTDTCGRGNFWIRKEKVVDTKISGCMWTGPKTRRRMTTAITEFPTKMTLVHARPLLGIEKFSYSLCLGFVNNLTRHVTTVRAITVNLIMWGKINTQLNHSLPADVLWDSLVTHSFLLHGRNECVTNESQRTSAGRLTESQHFLFYGVMLFRTLGTD